MSGGNGADTLWSGTGNDTLTGEAGSDVFAYAGGNDVITDYSDADGDLISLGAAISSSSIKGSDATFKIGSNTLNVKTASARKLFLSTRTVTNER